MLSEGLVVLIDEREESVLELIKDLGEPVLQWC